MQNITINEIVKRSRPDERFTIDQKTVKRLHDNIKRKEEQIAMLKARVAWLELNQSSDKFVIYG